jgi:hypothetical protein
MTNPTTGTMKQDVTVIRREMSIIAEELKKINARFTDLGKADLETRRMIAHLISTNSYNSLLTKVIFALVGLNFLGIIMILVT